MNERGGGPSSVIGHGTVVGWSRHWSGVALHMVLLNEKKYSVEVEVEIDRGRVMQSGGGRELRTDRYITLQCL